MKTNLTKKQVSQLTKNGKKEPRFKGGSMEGLLYEPSKNKLTATNGHGLITYIVESDLNDSNGILPIELFKSKISDSCTYEINGSAKRVNNNEISTYNLIEAEYPDYESVIPLIDNKFEVGINLDLLKKLCDAVPKDNDSNRNVKLTFDVDNNKSAIKFEQLSSDVNYSGLIMPVRLSD